MRFGHCRDFIFGPWRTQKFHAVKLWRGEFAAYQKLTKGIGPTNFRRILGRLNMAAKIGRNSSVDCQLPVQTSYKNGSKGWCCSRRSKKMIAEK